MTTPDASPPAPPGAAPPPVTPPLHRQARHWAGFIASGGTATVVDATLLLVFTKGLGLGPLVARALGICGAMVVGWLMHRRLTFAVAHPPTLGEFARYAVLQWSAIAVNFAVYAAVLFVWPNAEPLLALVVACAVAMIVSYAGMRFGVFRKHV